MYGENNVNSKSTELSFVAVEKRVEYVESTKATQLYKDYHRIGSSCEYWGTERAQTPDPMNGGSKRHWESLARKWRVSLRHAIGAVRKEQIAEVKQHSGYTEYHSEGSRTNYWGSSVRAQTPDPTSFTSMDEWSRKMDAWKSCLMIKDDQDVVGGARGRGRPRQRAEKETARSRSPALKHGENTCLRVCLEVLIDQVITGYDCGPYRALSDGNKMLEPFNYIVTPTYNRFLLQNGRYLILKRKHFRGFTTMWNEVFCTF